MNAVRRSSPSDRRKPWIACSLKEDSRLYHGILCFSNDDWAIKDSRSKRFLDFTKRLHVNGPLDFLMYGLSQLLGEGHFGDADSAVDNWAPRCFGAVF